MEENSLAFGTSPGHLKLGRSGTSYIWPIFTCDTCYKYSYHVFVGATVLAQLLQSGEFLFCSRSAMNLLRSLPLITTAVAQLSISVVNNLPGNMSTHAYVTAQNLDNDLVFLQADNTWYYPELGKLSSAPSEVSQSIAIPLAAEGAITAILLPSEFLSGRVWFATGNLTFYMVLDNNDAAALIQPSVTDIADPNNHVHWGFVELSYTVDSGIFVDLSYVDFVGLPLGISLESQDGGIQEVLGLSSNATSDLCDRLRRQGPPWEKLCVTDSDGTIHRVLSPNSYIRQNSSAFQDYYSTYVNKVWSTYSQKTLTVNPQTLAGNITCTVLGDTLNCVGDDRGYSKPSAAAIFGCDSGPFSIDATDNSVHLAVVPRLCAAFQRATLLLNGGDLQPGLNPSFYYTTDPNNLYSKFVHELELDGKGYAFPYDDVDPCGADQSGLISSQSPKLLTITVGGTST